MASEKTNRLILITGVTKGYETNREQLAART